MSSNLLLQYMHMYLLLHVHMHVRSVVSDSLQIRLCSLTVLNPNRQDLHPVGYPTLPTSVLICGHEIL